MNGNGVKRTHLNLYISTHKTAIHAISRTHTRLMARSRNVKRENDTTVAVAVAAAAGRATTSIDTKRVKKEKKNAATKLNK